MSRAASQTTHRIAAIAVAFPERAAIDLHEMLSHDLSIQSPSQEREIELGLLVEYIETKRKLPRRDEYREVVKARHAIGETHWHTDDQLCDTFGRWEFVLSAAMYIVEDRSDRRVRRKTDGRIARDRKRKYTRDECKGALIQFRVETGDWPRTPSEFQLWQKVKRRHALSLDQNSTEWLPSAGLVKAKFGDDWERALHLAKKKYASRF